MLRLHSPHGAVEVPELFERGRFTQWCYWIGFLLDWMVSGWILDGLDRGRHRYWMDWIIVPKSSWIQ